MPVELVVVLLVVAMVALLILPWAKGAHFRSRKIGCVNNQKQISLAALIWAGDNNDLLPMGVTITNGGSMEDVLAGKALSTFMVMSNELSTPRILWCPDDRERRMTNNFAGLTTTNISYFVNMDETNTMNPQMIRFGDRHLEANGKPVRPGMVVFGEKDQVTWSATLIHKKSGNISMADGSVQSTTSDSLKNFLQTTGVATNRFAIP